MVSKYNRAQDKIRHYTVNACITPVCSMYGLAVTTVEGIGDTRKGLHTIQKCLAEAHGIQCGFCTPGMVMSMYTLVRNNPKPTQEDIQTALEGNLCRCTGYRSIIDGFTQAVQEICCGGKGKDCPCLEDKTQNGGGEQDTDQVNTGVKFVTSDPTQDPIFPPELQLPNSLHAHTLTFEYEKTSWIRPHDFVHLLYNKAEFPASRLVAGGTTVARTRRPEVFIGVSHIPELNVLEVTEEGLKIGSALTLGELKIRLPSIIESLPDWKARSLKALQNTIRWVAADQIKNVATVGGSLLNPATSSDLQPLFLVMEAMLHVESAVYGPRTIPYREALMSVPPLFALQLEDVLVSVSFTFTSETDHIICYKQPERRGFDTSIVNAALLVSFQDDRHSIRDLNLVFGGKGFSPMLHFQNSLSYFSGSKWQDSLYHDISKIVGKKIETRGGVSDYHRSLALGFLFKFFLSIGQEVNSLVKALDTSAIEPLTYKPYETTRVYEQAPEDQPEYDTIYRPIPQFCAKQMTCGEASYLDDTSTLEDELFAGLVLSTKAHAKIIKVDPCIALALPGVVGYVDHRDVPGQNIWGCAVQNEYVLAEEKVFCYGQIIGIVLAVTKELARKAATMVKVQYEELKAILTIEEAIKENSFFTEFATRPSIVSGDVNIGFAESDHILEGEVNIGAQEHYYMETQGVLAIPRREHNEFDVYCTSQNPTKSQTDIASALGLPKNKIIVHVKRMGGGFGGKEIRNSLLAQPVAVAAYKYQRPVRCVLTRREDMLITGKRPPFKGKYKIGFKKDGKIQSLALNIYLNAGYGADICYAVLQQCILHCDGSYKIQHGSYHGHLCKTNLPPNTACRGFGLSEVAVLAETVIRHVALFLGIPVKEMQEKNFYQEGDKTHSNQILKNVLILPCWRQCLEESNYDVRLTEVKKFNSENCWKKRGIAMVPLRFGIGYREAHICQAGALVQVYTDGSVLLTHGGTEMGQGLNTKMIQVASRVLGIPMSDIDTNETSTATVPNTSSTAASFSSDLNGMAVMNACNKILKRMKPVIDTNPSGSFKSWVKEAYHKQISLSATGFHKSREKGGYFFETNSGQSSEYFTYGAGCSEVEIDCLTGECQILQVDMVMDVGKSLNPGIDIGQIEGAFLQGIGQLFLEKVSVSSDGAVQKAGPDDYRIPSIRTIPRKINVSLLKNSENVHGIYSSKGVSEPPLLLSSSAYFAVKSAIMSARTDAGIEGFFDLPCPATTEEVCLACKDQFTERTL